MVRNRILMSLLVAIITIAIFKSATAETNTVSSTVVTNNTPPTANSPSVVVNNSDVCKTAVAGAVQTQILGISSGITVTGSTTSETLISTIATGTAPLTVASTTMVSNLNADKLDDKEFTDIIAEATALAIALG